MKGKKKGKGQEKEKAKRKCRKRRKKKGRGVRRKRSKRMESISSRCYSMSSRGTMHSRGSKQSSWWNEE